jgi:D-3-phosphoglycerate dehydrogenase
VSARTLTVIATGPSGPPEELDPLRAAGHEVVIGRPLDLPARQAYAEAELIEQCRVADVVLASHLERVSATVMEHAEHLGLVIVPFIGVDKIDVPAATRLGVLVANSPTPENFIAVAEATIGLVLMLLKRVKRGESRLRRGEWARREDRGDFLFGKTVGIVGLGRIGTHVARRLAPWDVRLIAADPYVAPERAAALGVSLVDLPTLLAEADIVTIHAVLTEETRGLIGEKELRRMKPTALLLNTARGELVDESAVARAIQEGWIAAAAVDAFALEPLPARRRSRAPDPHPAQHRPQRGRAARQPPPGPGADPGGGPR